MSEKHTPGPWLVKENGLAGYGDNGPNFYINGPKQKSIAVLSLTHRLLDNGETPRYLQARADARLIAAAPELLAALQVALERLEALCSCEENSGCEDAKRRTILRAAIAKATGGTPC